MSDNHDDLEKAARERSPSFPFISLPRAVERLREMSDAHKKSHARLPVVGATWGYAPKSSGLLQTVAALKAYGLIDDVGSGQDRKVQITDLGWRILHDARPGSKDAAIREAALKPRLIAEYAQQWADERPSDAHCMSELQLDRGFSEAAANTFLKVFDNTIDYAGLQKSDMNDLNLEGLGMNSDETKQGPQGATVDVPTATVVRPANLAVSGEPFKLEIFEKHIELVARLIAPEQVDELIRRLQFAKMMITPARAAGELQSDSEGECGSV